MNHINIEIKARCSKEQQNKIRDYLNSNNAKFIGTDNQIDTYFKIPKGRLKIRKGDIENSLIYYNRENKKDSKESNIEMYNLSKDSYLENLIKEKCEVLVIVDKKREIYFKKNVKFHIDEVKDLGEFIEIEAISQDNTVPIEKIKRQCQYYRSLFNIEDKDLISESYSDMLLNKRQLDLK
jgi:adenylate cyclase, class 2